MSNCYGQWLKGARGGSRLTVTVKDVLVAILQPNRRAEVIAIKLFEDFIAENVSVELLIYVGRKDCGIEEAK